MSVTGTDIITAALLRAGVTGVGNPPSADQTTRALALLNDMLAVWSSKRWLNYALLDFGITCTGQQSYSIGPGGDIAVTARPDRIEAAYINLLNTGNLPVSYPLDQILSREDYSKIALKTMKAQPDSYWYDSNFPLGRIYPIPIPQNSTYELHVVTRIILPVLATAPVSIVLPPEYTDAMKWNLALRCRAEWRLPPAKDINELAQDGLNTIRSSNVQVPTMDLPYGFAGKGGLYNIYSDSFTRGG